MSHSIKWMLLGLALALPTQGQESAPILTPKMADIEAHTPEVQKMLRHIQAEVEETQRTKGAVLQGMAKAMQQKMDAAQAQFEETVRPLQSTGPAHDYVVLSTLDTLKSDYRLAAASRAPEGSIRIVLRGLTGHDRNFIDVTQTIRKTIGHSRQYARKLAIDLDPRPFRATGSLQAPTLIRYNAAGEIEAYVKGLINVAWLDEEIAKGGRDDLGTHGDTQEVKERDLVAEMKGRARGIDWQQQITASKKEFWKKQQFVHLPAATTTRTRLLDPSIIVQQDIVDEKGKVVVPKGLHYNPLNDVPFKRKIVIFDGRSEDQIAFAARQGKSGYATIFLTTEFGDRSFAAIHKLENQLNASVHVLMQHHIERLDLKYLPTIISREGNQLQLEEVAL